MVAGRSPNAGAASRCPGLYGVLINEQILKCFNERFNKTITTVIDAEGVSGETGRSPGAPDRIGGKPCGSMRHSSTCSRGTPGT